MNIIGAGTQFDATSPFPGGRVRMIIDKRVGSQRLSVGELTIEPASRVPRQVNSNTEEALIILMGKVDLVIGNERSVMDTGDAALVPAGTVWSALNRYHQPAKILFMYPTQEIDLVYADGASDTADRTSEKGLSGYVSPNERPLSEASS